MCDSGAGGPQHEQPAPAASSSASPAGTAAVPAAPPPPGSIEDRAGEGTTTTGSTIIYRSASPIRELGIEPGLHVCTLLMHSPTHNFLLAFLLMHAPASPSQAARRYWL